MYAPPITGSTTGRWGQLQHDLEEMDEFFAALVTPCRLNPAWVRRRIGRRDVGREAYEKQNYHPL